MKKTKTIYGIDVPQEDSWGHPIEGQVLYGDSLYESEEDAYAAKDALEWEMTSDMFSNEYGFPGEISFLCNHINRKDNIIDDSTLAKLIKLVYRDVVEPFTDDEICQINRLIGKIESHSVRDIFSDPANNLSDIKDLCHSFILDEINDSITWSGERVPIQCEVVEYNLVLR